LGTDGTHFLIGASLYTHGNFWGIANPPADWDAGPQAVSDLPGAKYETNAAPKAVSSRQSWPYNVVSASGQGPLAKK
jgi:hypothetical protein